jgi:4'-phosphopantetheinyl transferase EntD
MTDAPRPVGETDAALTPHAIDAVRKTMRRLVPPEVAVAVWEWEGGATDAEPDPIYPEEDAAIARAVPKRAVEFRRGRACARAALAELGAAPEPIPVAATRAPVWPAGFVGSITHCRGLVAAVAARTERIVALGLDAEPVGPLPDGTHHLILHPLDRRGPDGALDKVVFSAKESIFKTLFPLTGVWLDFRDVVVELDEGRGHFHATPAPDATAHAPRLEDLRGAYAVADGFVITASYLAAPGL